MEESETPNPESTELEIDSNFKAKVQRLHQLTVYGRWLLVTILWLTLAPLSLWGWRYEISLLRSHFTWAALRYGIIFNRLPFLGFSLCVAITASVLVWHSRNILWGMPLEEKKRLEKQVHRICQQGKSHPLWRWVCYVRETEDKIHF